MLEDFAMEKKPSSRSVQTPSKGCGTEVKKAQDSTSNVGKQFPRQSRRREPPGPKWDQNRKAFLQKQNKTAYNDPKRPKPRGQLYHGCGKASTQVVDELTEQFGLVSTSPNGGSKKQSLNHLLNFHYAPRGEHNVASFHHRGGGSGHHYYNSARWLMSTQKHKYNKEQFLQANCQFVVRSDGDYTAYMGDPDILVDWDKIEQIKVISCEDVNCPICLSTPVAGKITRCGHVFCWSCMLHYLALSDKSWRKCPICYESVHRDDLKSVEILLRATHTIGEQITFRLMKRERGSLITSPVSQYSARALHGLLSVNEDKLDIIYSKLLTANTEQVSAILDKEKAELEAQVAENEGCPELCFIEQALQLLKERKHDLIARTCVSQVESKIGHTGSDDNSCTQNTSLPLPSSLSSRCSDDSNNNTSNKMPTAIHNNSVDKKIIDEKVIENCFSNSNHARCGYDSGDKNHLYTVSSSDHNSDIAGDSDLEMALLSPDLGEDVSLARDTLDERAASSVTDDCNSLCRMSDTAANAETDVTTIEQRAKTDVAGERCRYFSASSVSEGEDSVTAGNVHTTSITVEDLDISSIPNSTSNAVNKHFYFYQAEDGQQIFLHAVNVRMLEMNYGSLENSPPVITGTILEKESGSMTEELRKRLRYLQHLPVTCQFEVAEIELQPPVITLDTLNFFKEQLEARRKRREKRARDERRRERKMVEQVHKQYGRGPAPRLRIESLHHFPQCGSELVCSPSSVTVLSKVTSPIENTHVERPSSASSRASSPVSIVSSSPPSSSSVGPSFAQMLRDGKSTGTSWNTNSVQLHRAADQSQTHYDSDNNDCNPSAAPQYRQSFREAFAMALEQVEFQHDKDESESHGRKKKKRKQKVLLFATGMACNSK